ncbi:redox-regulated ATPase YchF [candidate division KSB1 bacterium]|nr:redox-regulated ATPase YchF [candidate division KSB1 bacterium]NIR69205.1 redox-regulated ATPase YchF [candidate division KSB1 bacterium]NIS27382.1 redox-regulated ATPase YchF [candidate division KSB1 bacterium]NIT74207.1 redox-regulated ATPase YchF [candidate division KSB1 bacterium]NIU28099.1 redox-regulated ATPase YchF [candidate division KSB1 bacterium]
MALRIGIVGLPNVGKSTTFNALVKEQNAQVASYPFCTMEPNKAIVPVPDPRVEKLAELAKVGKTIHATIEFVDIAGLVKGASHGEGLGNQFLGNIRDTAAIVHVVRCFEDPNVAHVSETLDPWLDIEIVNTELALADLQQLERKIERLARQVKGDKKAQPLLNMAQALQAHLNSEQPISTFPQQNDDAFRSLNKEMQFLTSKPVIYVANVDESGLEADNESVQAVRDVAHEQQAEVVKLCAKLEEDMADMSDDERHELLELAGTEESGLEQVIHKSFQALGLISFFTMNEKEVRAWNIPKGTQAPQAAGAIHTDFERGFIQAEVISYETFVAHGSAAAVKAAGEMRMEGKDYIVQDGDVIYFRFNV